MRKKLKTAVRCIFLSLIELSLIFLCFYFPVNLLHNLFCTSCSGQKVAVKQRQIVFYPDRISSKWWVFCLHGQVYTMKPQQRARRLSPTWSCSLRSGYKLLKWFISKPKSPLCIPSTAITTISLLYDKLSVRRSISSSLAYGAFISQPRRYAKSYTCYDGFFICHFPISF